MIYVLVGAAVLAYLVYLVVSLLLGWRRDIADTITSGRRKHETTGQIAVDIGEEAAVGAAEVAVGLAVGNVIGAGGSAATGGSFGGGGAAGSW